MVISSALSRSRKINEVKFMYDLMMLEGSVFWMTGGEKKSHRKNERERKMENRERWESVKETEREKERRREN